MEVYIQYVPGMMPLLPVHSTTSLKGDLMASYSVPDIDIMLSMSTFSQLWVNIGIKVLVICCCWIYQAKSQ